MRSFHPVLPAPELPVWLFENRGPSRVFPDRLALARWLGPVNLSDHCLWPALHDGSIGAHPFGAVVAEHRWAARQGGDVLTNDELLDLLPRRVFWRQHRAEALGVHMVYRSTPVPHTGRYRGHHGRMMRSPRTLQLLREALFDFRVDPDVPPVRSRLRNHPTRWDDCLRSNAVTRTWKNRRAHQWR